MLSIGGNAVRAFFAVFFIGVNHCLEAKRAALDDVFGGDAAAVCA
jgi:hypothetical protein